MFTTVKHSNFLVEKQKIFFDNFFYFANFLLYFYLVLEDIRVSFASFTYLLPALYLTKSFFSMLRVPGVKYMKCYLLKFIYVVHDILFNRKIFTFVSARARTRDLETSSRLSCQCCYTVILINNAYFEALLHVEWLREKLFNFAAIIIIYYGNYSNV